MSHKDILVRTHHCKPVQLGKTSYRYYKLQILQITKDNEDSLVRIQRQQDKNAESKFTQKGKKVVSLNDCIKEMKDKELVGPVAAAPLVETFSGLSSEIILNHFNNRDKSSRGNRHSDESKKFALTLHFYSPRVYEHVRSVFRLPHP